MSVACGGNITEAAEKVNFNLVSIAVKALKPLGVNILSASVLIFFTELSVIREKVNISVGCLCQPCEVIYTYGVNLDIFSLYLFTEKYTRHFSKNILSAENLMAAAEGLDFGENSVKSLDAKCHRIGVVYNPRIG